MVKWITLLRYSHITMVLMIRNLINESVFEDLGLCDNPTFLDELLRYLQSNSKETIMIVQNKIFISILSGKFYDQ